MQHQAAEEAEPPTMSEPPSKLMKVQAAVSQPVVASFMAGGVAGEYFRAAHGIAAPSTETQGDEVNFVKPSAADLGLLGKKASSERLSPAKDRKRHFGIGAISSAGSDAMGGCEVEPCWDRLADGRRRTPLRGTC